jgi:acetyltransferase
MTQAPTISRDIRTTIDTLLGKPRVLRDQTDLGQAVHVLCGEKVTVRPARPQDSCMIQDYIRGLSPASRRNRFLGALNEVSANELYRMTHSDRGSHPVLIAENIVQGHCTMIGEARYAAAPDGFQCEFAVSVDEAWRRKGLGTLLVGIVAFRAQTLGLRYLIGDVFRSNEAMIKLTRKTGFALIGPVADARLVKITKDLSLPDAARPWSELASALPVVPSLTCDLISARLPIQPWQSEETNDVHDSHPANGRPRATRPRSRQSAPTGGLVLG